MGGGKRVGGEKECVSVTNANINVAADVSASFALTEQGTQTFPYY